MRLSRGARGPEKPKWEAVAALEGTTALATIKRITIPSLSAFPALRGTKNS
jgi:hypothetical protein